jgi:hypothetical protein
MKGRIVWDMMENEYCFSIARVCSCGLITRRIECPRCGVLREYLRKHLM